MGGSKGGRRAEEMRREEKRMGIVPVMSTWAPQCLQ